MTGQSDTIQELTYYVQRADKDLFLKLKDGIYTLDQLKARIAERRDGFRYMVLDDLKEQLNPSFFEGNEKEKSKRKGRAASSQDGDEMKEDFIFKVVSRGQVPKHLDYQRIPESLGTVDFFQREISERVKVKQQKFSSANLFKIPNPKEILPGQLNQKAMRDPEKEKKQLNVMKLKKQLAQKLRSHKLLKMKEMPYDSSSVKFHDQMDMFFKSTDILRPVAKNGEKPKKQDTPKQRTVNEYQNGFEQRKKENQERRAQILFLKRLENDGAKISISKQDRDLLKNLGKVEDELAEKELEQAILIDHYSNTAADDALLIEAEANEKEEGNQSKAGDKSIQNLKIKKMKEACAETQAVAVQGENKKKVTRKWTTNGRRHQRVGSMESQGGKARFLTRIQSIQSKVQHNLRVRQEQSAGDGTTEKANAARKKVARHNIDLENERQSRDEHGTTFGTTGRHIVPKLEQREPAPASTQEDHAGVSPEFDRTNEAEHEIPEIRQFGQFQTVDPGTDSPGLTVLPPQQTLELNRKPDAKESRTAHTAFQRITLVSPDNTSQPQLFSNDSQTYRRGAAAMQTIKQTTAHDTLEAKSGSFGTATGAATHEVDQSESKKKNRSMHQVRFGVEQWSQQQEMSVYAALARDAVHTSANRQQSPMVLKQHKDQHTRGGDDQARHEAAEGHPGATAGGTRLSSSYQNQMASSNPNTGYRTQQRFGPYRSSKSSRHIGGWQFAEQGRDSLSREFKSFAG